ncbi:MAG: class II glutamine amidotransferase [Saprospiraceae bacterium]|nr:class II glutamine amidotransferase [Saprospiraceae bacterium]
MCRFLSYLGPPITIDELLVKPDHSLINQSYDAKEMSEPLNGDGFGLGWYVRKVRQHPGLFRSITPAWNNQNLLYNASLIKTDCLFAHVRAASEGGVFEPNCHPFRYKEFLMMHNGGIRSFPKVKRKLIDWLTDEFFLWIKGQTDSEHIFALLMQNLADIKSGEASLDVADIADGFKRTFEQLEHFKREAGIEEEVSAYNMMITDGIRVFGTRYSTQPEKITPTLYYYTGNRFHCEEGETRMENREDEPDELVIVASERLTKRADEWKAIPPNHFIGISEDKSVELIALS